MRHLLECVAEPRVCVSKGHNQVAPEAFLKIL